MRRRIGQWLIMAIAVPIIASAIGVIADKVEERRGADSKVVKGLKVSKKVLRTGT